MGSGDRSLVPGAFPYYPSSQERRLSVKDEQREIVGFFCRWCLLGLAWAGLAAAGFVGVVAASPHQETPRAFLSDEVFLPTRYPWTMGRLVPPPKAAADVWLLVRVGDQVSVAGYDESDLLFLPLARPARGDIRIGVIGMPFVFLMFPGDAGTLRFIAPDERVFLIDSSLDASAGGASPVLWARALAALRRRGGVAFLHPGPAAEFQTYRQDLRRRGIGDPVLCAFARGGAAATLTDARSALRAKDRRADLTTVVTGSRALSRAAAEMGFGAIWIVPRGVQAPSGEAPVKAFASLDSFVQSIDAEAGER